MSPLSPRISLRTSSVTFRPSTAFCWAMRFSTSRTAVKYSSSLLTSSRPSFFSSDLASSRTASMTLRSGKLESSLVGRLVDFLPTLLKSLSNARCGFTSYGMGVWAFFHEMWLV